MIGNILQDNNPFLETVTRQTAEKKGEEDAAGDQRHTF